MAENKLCAWRPKLAMGMMTIDGGFNSPVTVRVYLFHVYLQFFQLNVDLILLVFN